MGSMMPPDDPSGAGHSTVPGVASVGDGFNHMSLNDKVISLP